MRKLVKRMGFATLMVMATFGSSMAANNQDLCELIKNLGGVFRTLRTLAFVGAAFLIAAWAWGYIAGGEAKLDDVKKKGVALLVGFGLLFLVGVAVSAILAAAGQGGALECDIGTFKEAFK